jgi:succinate dehydrogenase / fumarate reductase flavoprotein subunit
MGLGINGEMQVYLDVSHLSDEKKQKLKAILEIYQKFTGDDPKKVPMRIFPAMHYTMGGAWVDWPAADDHDRFDRFRQMTNLHGCFNVGESDYQYHGANRLGANALLSCIFSGLVAGQEVPRYLDQLTHSYRETPSSVFESALNAEQDIKKDLLSRKGIENIHRLHDELSDWMLTNVTVKRNNADLLKTLNKLKELRERYQHISLDDRTQFANQTYAVANQFGPMLEIAMVITKGALLRNEFRGAHYKPEFPERNDKEWLKTTLATYQVDEPRIEYAEVDLRHLQPIQRDYTQAKKIKPKLENIPANLILPI